jgi:regulator of sigma E protease
MLQILIAIFGLSFLVVVHEAGHYFVARAFGIRVLRFSIGFGPVLVKYQPKASPTVFQLSAIPFGAFVMMAGRNPAEDVDTDDPGLYGNKSTIARILTTAGGPVANYLTASLLIFALALSGWRSDTPTDPMVIDSIEAGSPAAVAGLQSGDVVRAVEGRAIHSVRDLSEVTSARPGLATQYVIERAGKLLPPLAITPRDAGGRGVLGVSPRVHTVYRALPLSDAAKVAVVLPFKLTVENIAGMADLIRRRSTEGLTGPVGIGKLVAQQAEKGVYAFVQILIAISVALGSFNLLPIPALDGGHLLFLGYEMITRRKSNERIEAVVHTVGFVLLMGVIALVTLRDMVG